MLMDKKSTDYWNKAAASSPAEARDAILLGFRDEKAFDETGELDVQHLVLPFISSSDVVVDVGCGIGRLLKWVAPHCRQVVGLDVSGEMLKLARRRLRWTSNVQLKKIPLSLKLPLPDQSADFIYFYHVSEHLEREDTFSLLGEIRRCLRKSGSALVQVSLIKHPDNREAFKEWVGVKDNASVRSRFYTEEEFLLILDMLKLYPQVRLFIPGELALVVTPKDSRVLGEMPLVRLHSEHGAQKRKATASR
jgi:SAM-dependent methyltransferase